MKICAFIGDLYRDYSAGVVRTLRTLSLERGHHVDLYGNCSVPSDNPLHAVGLKSVLSLPRLNEYDGIILCSDTLFHQYVGESPINYLMHLRSRKVAELLRAGKMPMTQIAAETGFGGVSYMAETFKKFFESSPREYRKQWEQS
jgi:hypothetical protein